MHTIPVARRQGRALTETARRRLLERCYQRMLAATTPERARFWFRAMARLIAGRGPEDVARMERERGLRP